MNANRFFVGNSTLGSLGILGIMLDHSWLNVNAEEIMLSAIGHLKSLGATFCFFIKIGSSHFTAVLAATIPFFDPFSYHPNDCGCSSRQKVFKLNQILC
ncbi:hypothetical protein CANARDRAFT_27893 [[Candida] arabinofermentans NRRL YB-2248]|uniref:Uncharacterized protein n=1 Tax=[Candida] arabinofermentans NRRL YB-2248 TaxID=983967 RepID=A0A1E4T227_9ASCO|nr:hypothetical protein CANARDRAFT_27893 [[Candida] arabinofermentans NRRL YB-2248]